MTQDALSAIANIGDDDFKDFDPIPPGVYSAVLEEISLGLAKSGKPTLKWVYRIYNSDTPGTNGRLVFDRTPVPSGWLKSRLAALGVDWETFKADLNANGGKSSWVDTKVTLTTGSREYEGKTYETVEAVAPAA